MTRRKGTQKRNSTDISTNVNGFTFDALRPCFAAVEKVPERAMTISYDGFDIESFEAGRGLWHARIKRADQEPVVIDGLPFDRLEVGFAWPDPEGAIAHAKTQIDRFKARHKGVTHVAV
jgi:hypothetical protein